MVESLKQVQPVVSLPQANGHVEITVTDNMIWVSDYAAGPDGKEISNFTLCIPRGPLDGAQAASQGVHDKYAKQTTMRIKKGAGSNAEFDRIVAAITAAPPSKAGYWFAHPTLKAHGGPVVVVDP